ncbi:Predicted methyltransferase [Ceraceosorus bombacis]|uniref:Predicted methyltransferase n=1 Tax=Ceraceosorus bombacis TaxID=401625 RepID=A0A0P1BL56_9BASI|nr:Predicted methyltransferase [Ceraceosorus bombacis]
MSLLTTTPAPAGGLKSRLLEPFFPLILLAALLYHGLVGAILLQVRAATLDLKPWKLLSPWAWRDAVLAHGFPIILEGSDKTWKEVKDELIRANASGKVLEVGAGSGMTLKYYDTDKVTSLTLLEPFASLHAPLRRAASQLALRKDRVHILPFGIQEREELRKQGVKQRGYDTILLVQVLCSIPEPKSHLEYLQSLLAPGGKLLLFEHVLSGSTLTRLEQYAWTYTMWRFVANGCCLDRASGEWVRDIGGWKDVRLMRPKDENSAALVPHAVGIFTKA